MTTIKTLSKKAKILGYIRTGNFRHGAEFFYFCKKHNLDFQEYEAKNFFVYPDTKEEMKKKLKKIDSWTTYSHNLDVSLTFNKNDFEIKVIIWDGEILEGRRTRKRFTLIFKELKYNKIIKEFEEDINFLFYRHAEEIYEERKEAQRTAIIKEIEKEILAE